MRRMSCGEEFLMPALCADGHTQGAEILVSDGEGRAKGPIAPVAIPRRISADILGSWIAVDAIDERAQR